MSQLARGTNFGPEGITSAQQLYDFLEGATLQPGAITDQVQVTPASTDILLLFSPTTGKLQKATIGQVSANLGVPTGTIIYWSDKAANPEGFVNAGTTVSRTTYAALFALFGTLAGAGNGTTTFRLPGAPILTIDNDGTPENSFPLIKT